MCTVCASSHVHCRDPPRQQWLEKYSLDSLGLSLPRYKSGGPKQKMFMHPTKQVKQFLECYVVCYHGDVDSFSQGGVVHLALDRNALVQYSRDLKLCQRMFEERLTWITTGEALVWLAM